MAVTESIRSVTARPVLNDGLDSSGNIVTINGSFGSALSSSQFEEATLAESNQKLLNIVSALEPCLSLTVYQVTKTTTVSIESD